MGEELVKVNSSEDNVAARNSAALLYDVAALTSGYEIEDSADFAQRILSMMVARWGGDVTEAKVEATTQVAEDTAKDPTGDSARAEGETTTAPELTDAQKDFFG